MQYNVKDDVSLILELLEMSNDDFAGEIGVTRMTVNNWLRGRVEVGDWNIDKIYSFAYKQGLRLNKIKEQLYREDIAVQDEHLLFHGAKEKIEGPLSLKKSRGTNDFGKGFYCGESLEQSAMFVATFPRPSLYMLRFNSEGLTGKVFAVDREWMLNVAYYRGSLKKYENSRFVQDIAIKNTGIDYIIAPIADNRMFAIIDQFIDGELTDVQCQHCLAATDLGKQYVLLTEKAISKVDILERCYLAEEERMDYIESRRASHELGRDKVKLARKKFRNQGEYIEDILK